MTTLSPVLAAGRASRDSETGPVAHVAHALAGESAVDTTVPELAKIPVPWTRISCLASRPGADPWLRLLYDPGCGRVDVQLGVIVHRSCRARNSRPARSHSAPLSAFLGRPRSLRRAATSSLATAGCRTRPGRLEVLGGRPRRRGGSRLEPTLAEVEGDVLALGLVHGRLGAASVVAGVDVRGALLVRWP